MLHYLKLVESSATSLTLTRLLDFYCEFMPESLDGLV